MGRDERRVGGRAGEEHVRTGRGRRERRTDGRESRGQGRRTEKGGRRIGGQGGLTVGESAQGEGVDVVRKASGIEHEQRRGGARRRKGTRSAGGTILGGPQQ
jgi:hypothetical protein